MNICVHCTYTYMCTWVGSEIPVSCAIDGGIVVMKGGEEAEEDDEFWRPDDVYRK